jgi:hypothetical protein
VFPVQKIANSNQLLESTGSGQTNEMVQHGFRVSEHRFVLELVGKVPCKAAISQSVKQILLMIIAPQRPIAAGKVLACDPQNSNISKEA